MIFRHKNFQLDDEQQIVFDDQGEELRIFGNEYLVLDYLCKNKKATRKELAVLLDLGELYNGNRIVKLVEYINGKIKEEVIQFKGDVYSLVGEVEGAKIVFNLEKKNEDGIQEKKEEKAEDAEIFMGLTLKELLLIGAGIIVGIVLVKLILDFLL